MKANYFVILNCQKHANVDALLDDNDELMLFSTEADARKAALSSVFGEWFGYEIFQLGTGSN